MYVCSVLKENMRHMPRNMLLRDCHGELDPAPSAHRRACPVRDMPSGLACGIWAGQQVRRTVPNSRFLANFQSQITCFYFISTDHREAWNCFDGEQLLRPCLVPHRFRDTVAVLFVCGNYCSIIVVLAMGKSPSDMNSPDPSP